MGDCSNMLCCRKDSGKTEDEKKRTGRFGFPGRCDIPMVIFELRIGCTGKLSKLYH